MEDDLLIHTLALHKAFGIGDRTAKKLVEHTGSPIAVFKEKNIPFEKISGINALKIKKALSDKTLFEKAENELKFIRENNLKVHYYKNDNYPSLLKNCIDSPILLFGSGSINLNNPRIISIVGTRNITTRGKEICEKLVDELSLFNPIIVSGFALGVDITAHKSAIKNNLHNIACTAHGHNQIYPQKHKPYVNDVEKNGGFLTEFWSTSNPERENFVRRNRVIAGLSQATIVIESASKGGSLITAKLANSYNREVFAVPGRVTDKYSQGCNNLIKQQRAHLIDSVADIVYHLNWDIETKKKKIIQPQLFIDLNDTEETIVNFLKEKGKTHLDEIAFNCKIPIFSLSGTLLNLELKGIVRPLPGKLFELM